MTDPENIIALIPGEYLASSQYGLPPPETCKGQYQEVTIDVPRLYRVRIRFEPFHHKRGKTSRWFWTPKSAVRVE